MRQKWNSIKYDEGKFTKEDSKREREREIERERERGGGGEGWGRKKQKACIPVSTILYIITNLAGGNY